jgi:hypothetical protein
MHQASMQQNIPATIACSSLHVIAMLRHYA